MACVEFLLKSGADPNARDELLGKTPLHLATWNSHDEVAELLVSWVADEMAVDDWGTPPTRHVTEGRHESSVKGTHQQED